MTLLSRQQQKAVWENMNSYMDMSPGVLCMSLNMWSSSSPHVLDSPQHTGVCSEYHHHRSSSQDSEWPVNGDAACSFGDCIIYSAL